MHREAEQWHLIGETYKQYVGFLVRAKLDGSGAGAVPVQTGELLA